jgi:hypothetical protein
VRSCSGACEAWQGKTSQEASSFGTRSKHGEGQITPGPSMRTWGGMRDSQWRPRTLKVSDRLCL